MRNRVSKPIKEIDHLSGVDGHPPAPQRESTEEISEIRAVNNLSITT
jgi:hypothetical protein